jgi:hypothetical protein
VIFDQDIATAAPDDFIDRGDWIGTVMESVYCIDKVEAAVRKRDSFAVVENWLEQDQLPAKNVQWHNILDEPIFLGAFCKPAIARAEVERGLNRRMWREQTPH